MFQSTLSITTFDEPARKIYGIRSRIGEIQIGEYKETFIMPLDSWKLRDYKQQWAEGFERIKNGIDSCLVATVQNLPTYPLVEMWLFYVGNKKITIYNQLLLQEILDAHWPKPKDLSLFSVKTCYEYIAPKSFFPENDTEVSRWEIDL